MHDAYPVLEDENSLCHIFALGAATTRVSIPLEATESAHTG